MGILVGVLLFISLAPAEEMPLVLPSCDDVLKKQLVRMPDKAEACFWEKHPLWDCYVAGALLTCTVLGE